MSELEMGERQALLNRHLRNALPALVCSAGTLLWAIHELVRYAPTYMLFAEFVRALLTYTMALGLIKFRAEHHEPGTQADTVLSMTIACLLVVGILSDMMIVAALHLSLR